MADETVKRKKCDNPRCETPYDNIKRVRSEIEGEGVAFIDLCRHDRQVLLTFRKWAHRTEKPKRIEITAPEDVRGR